MYVKSLTSKGSLLNGRVYKTYWVHNDPNSNSFFKGKLRIQGHGMFNCSDFTTMDGSPIPKQSILGSKKKLKKGDIISCETSYHYKYLVNGGKYRIADIKSEDRDFSMTDRWTRIKIKLEGYHRWLKWDSYRFRILDEHELRTIKINSILNKADNFSVDFKRKYEQTPDKIKNTFNLLAKAALNKKRHELDIVKWAILKNNHDDIQESELEDILNMRFGDILERIK